MSARWEQNQKQVAQQTLNVSATLRHQCCWSEKLSVLFEPRHARRIHSQYFYDTEKQ